MDGESEFGGIDRLTRVALAVLGNVDRKTDGRGLKALAADLANVAEVGAVKRLYEVLVSFERGTDVGDEIGRRLAAGAFGSHRRELIGGELVSVKVGAKPSCAAGEMFGVEAG